MYKVIWDLQARVLIPQLFLTPRDHAPKEMDALMLDVGRGYPHRVINSILVFDDLAELARRSAGVELTDHERRDLLLPENKIVTIKAPPNSNRSPRRTNRR